MRDQALSNLYESLQESVESNDAEYYKALESHYSKGLANSVRMQDNMASMMLGSPIQTHKTNDGSMIVRYIESDEAVAILGVVSVPGVKKGDYMRDLLNWIRRCVESLGKGKALFTSPNELTTPLLETILRKARASGIKLEVTKGNGMTDPISGKTWVNYIVEPSH